MGFIYFMVYEVFNRYKFNTKSFELIFSVLSKADFYDLISSFNFLKCFFDSA